MGFTAPIDSSILRGQGGVLDQLAARDATCQSILNYIRTHLPYAPAQTNGPSAASVIADPTLSGTDFAAAAAALAPRLESLVAALEQGAGATTGFDIQGGCGVGSVHVEAPELYDARAVAEGGVRPTNTFFERCRERKQADHDEREQSLHAESHTRRRRCRFELT
jgi:hypothetical protein